MALQSIDQLTKDQLKTFLNSFDTVISDCDDVLWVGIHLTPGAKEVMNRFKNLGKKICFVSNNSTLTRIQLSKKLQNIGYDVTIDDVINTSYLATLYLKELKLPFGTKVYLIGSAGLVKELEAEGIRHIGSGPDVLDNDVLTFSSTVSLDSSVGAVVVAFDPNFSVPKLIKASSYLNNPQVHFIATNPDLRCKYNNYVIPGAGTILQAVKTSSKREPVVIGKPNEYMCKTVLKKWIQKPERTLMIGDSCYTDILFGRRCGFQTLLVLTGINTLQEVTCWKNENLEDKHMLIPDYYINKLGDLLKWMA